MLPVKLPGMPGSHALSCVFVDIERETAGEMGNAYGRRMNVKEILKGQIEEEGRPKNL